MINESLTNKKTESKPAESKSNTQSLEEKIDELKVLLEENIAYTKKIKGWIMMQRVWGVVKILIIAIPIVLGAIYLPPLLEKAIEPYKQLLEVGQQASEAQNDVMGQINKLLGNGGQGTGE